MKSFEVFTEFKQLGIDKVYNLTFCELEFVRDYYAAVGNSDIQVGDWEERADETEGREFQYTVSLKLPSALQSALGGFGDMTLLEKQTLERGLSSYVISTEISPQSGLIGFKQVATWAWNARPSGGCTLTINATIEVLAGAPWGMKSSLEGIMVSQTKTAMQKWVELAQERVSMVASSERWLGAVHHPEATGVEDMAAALEEEDEVIPQLATAAGTSGVVGVPVSMTERAEAATVAGAAATAPAPYAPHPLGGGVNMVHCSTALHGAAMLVLGPILAKQASTQPSAILYFTAVVLGSYGLTIFGSYGLLEYSRRVGGGGGLLGSRIANTPPVTKPIAAPVAVPVATSAAPEPAATTTSGAVGASAAGIRKPKLLRTTSLEAQRGAGGGDHELLGLISSEISLLAIQLKGHPAQSGVLRLQSLLRASSSMAPRSPNRSSHHTPSKIGPAAVQQAAATATTFTGNGGDSASEAGGSRRGGGDGGGSVRDSGGQPKLGSPVATKLFAAGDGNGGGGGGSVVGTDDECEMKTSLEEEAATPEWRKGGESEQRKGNVVTSKAEGKAADRMDRNQSQQADTVDGAPAGAKQTSASHDVLNSFMQTHSSFTILEEQQRGLSVNAGTSTNNHGGGAAVAAMEADDGKAVVEVASANKGHARKSSGGGKKDRASKKKGAKGPKPQAAQAEAEARAVADVETRAAPTTPERSVTSGGGGGGAARQTVAATSSAPATPAQGGMRVTEEVATGTPAGGAGGKRVSRMERMQGLMTGKAGTGDAEAELRELIAAGEKFFTEDGAPAQLATSLLSTMGTMWKKGDSSHAGDADEGRSESQWEAAGGAASGGAGSGGAGAGGGVSGGGSGTGSGAGAAAARGKKRTSEPESYVQVKLAVAVAAAEGEQGEQGEDSSGSPRVVVQLNVAQAGSKGPAWDAASHYGLPPSEQPIQSFSAVNNKLVHGYVTITPGFVCFDTVLFAGGPNKVVLPVESIKAVKRVKFAQLFNNAMEMHLANGDELYFSGFLHRNDCVACIEQQAAKRGHPLAVL